MSKIAIFWKISIEIDQRIDAILKKMATYANEENGLILPYVQFLEQ